MAHCFCGDFQQLFFYDYFSRKSEKEKAKVAKIGKRKDQDEESSEEEEGDMEDVSADEADQKDEGDLPIQGADEDEDEDDSDEDEAKIWKVTNCPAHLFKFRADSRVGYAKIHAQGCRRG